MSPWGCHSPLGCHKARGFSYRSAPAGRRTEREPFYHSQLGEAGEQMFYPELHQQYQHYSRFSFGFHTSFPSNIKDSVRSRKHIPDHMFCDNILGPLIAPGKYCIKAHYTHTVGTLIHKQTPHPPKWTCDPQVQFQISHLASSCRRST